LHVEYDFADNSREIVCALLDNLAIWGDRLVSQERIPPE
jgi:hypothetical protein